MVKTIAVELSVPDDLSHLQLPLAINARLQTLLDRQDSGAKLTATERQEAEGLVSLSETLALLRLRAERAMQRRA